MQATRGKPKAAEPVCHCVARGFLIKREWEHTAGLDVAVQARVCDDWGCAEWALSSVSMRVKLHLSGAVGALGNTGFLNILSGELGLQCVFKIKFADGGASCETDLLCMSAVVAGEPVLCWIKSVVCSTGRAGEAVTCGHVGGRGFGQDILCL